MQIVAPNYNDVLFFPILITENEYWVVKMASESESQSSRIFSRRKANVAINTELHCWYCQALLQTTDTSSVYCKLASSLFKQILQIRDVYGFKTIAEVLQYLVER